MQRFGRFRGPSVARGGTPPAQNLYSRSVVYLPSTGERIQPMQTQRILSRFHRDLAEERGNCFLYGCVTLVILALLGGLVVFLTLRYAMQRAKEKYTEAAPIELPTVNMPQADIDALIQRVDQYAKDLRDGKPLEPITLTETDLNALLQNHPDLKEEYGDHMYLTLGDNTITAQMSIALDWLPLFRNRYFNGTATFDVGFTGGRPQIYLNAASVKGEEVPLSQVRELRGENFGDAWSDDPDARSLMRRIDTIVVKKEGITITPSNTDLPVEPIPSERESQETAPAEAA